MPHYGQTLILEGRKMEEEGMASQFDIKPLECFEYKVLENETLSDILGKNNDIKTVNSKYLIIETIKLQKFSCQCKNKDKLWFVIERIKYKTDPKTNKQEEISSEMFQVKTVNTDLDTDLNVESIYEFLKQFDEKKRKDLRERIEKLKSKCKTFDDFERLLQEAISCLNNNDCIGCEAKLNELEGLITEREHSRRGR
jgi:hypothetical protein